MRVDLIGVGLGNPQTMTIEGRTALEQADWVAGSRRLVEELAAPGQRTAAATKAGELLELIRSSGAKRPCVLYSGDTGFYSGTRTLVPLLEEAGIDCRVLPGISSPQYLAALLGEPWQDWKLVSAHGVASDPVGEVLDGRKVFFLTGGSGGAVQLCRALTEAGLGRLHAVVGEELSYPAQRLIRGTVAELAEQSFAPLSVLLVEGVEPARRAVTQGIGDEEFVRGKVPMTKQEVRAAALAKLAIRPDEILYDVGAGTGSVSVEMALLAKCGQVYAIEREEEGLELIRTNREKFGAWQLRVIPGAAPEVLIPLPPPDAVFIGGSGGKLGEIVDHVLEKNPAVRICISAIAVETLTAALESLGRHGLSAQVTQLWAARSRPAGQLHLMMGQNPVWLICANGEEQQ